MFKIDSPESLVSAFRPQDQAQVELPEGLHFPMGVRDYLTWSEPSGHRVFLVFADANPKKPIGVVFKRSASQRGQATAWMCDWCHSTSGGGRVELLTVDVDARRRVGVMVCGDLSCAEKAMGLSGRWGPGWPKGPDESEGPGGHEEFSYPDELSGRERVRRVLKKMSEFARRYLF